MKAFTLKTKHKLIGVLSAAFFILVWKIASLQMGSDIILPAPETVFLRLLAILQGVKFWQAVGATSLRTLYSLLLSFVLGFTAGIACGTSRKADSFLSPLISITRTAPVMSVILLSMIWFKTDVVPVFVGVLMVFPILTANVKQGVRNVDKRLIELGQAYKLSRRDVLCEITIPSVVPFVLAGLRSSIGVAWKVIIAAEVLSQPIKAVGTGLQFSQMNLETAEVMAWTVTAIILSWLSESVLDLIIRHRRWEAVVSG